MPDEDLLSTLRQLEPEPEPDYEGLVLQKLEFFVNLLEDMKLKQSITNELLLEIVEQGKVKARSDFASQARPIKNKPFPSVVRRNFGKHF